MYYTQEKLALQTLERICTLAKPAFGIWIHLSACSPWAEQARHTQVILNLLTPLTSKGGSRIFILKNTDILCLSIETPFPLISHIFGQIQTLLSPYIPGPVGQIFSLPADKKALMSSLFPQQIPLLWGGEPETTESLFVRQALICRQGEQLNFQFYLGLNSVKAQQDPYPLWSHQLKNFRPDLNGYWGTVADIYDTNKYMDTVVLGIDIHAALTEQQAYHDFRARYLHHKFALWGITPHEVGYFDLTDIPFDYLFWPAESVCPCLDKDKVICTHIQTQEQFAGAFAYGYHYFMGPFVQILTTMQYKKTCPFGQDCTLPVCTGALLCPCKDKKCICPDHLNKRNLYALA